MEITNHKEEVPFAHYAQRFAQADAAEIAGRLGTPFVGGAFQVELLGVSYTVTHPGTKISPDAPLPAQTFLLRWLLEGNPTRWNGQWKTFREMPWGELYIQPYTGRVLTRAAFTFGTRLDAFRNACQKLGATAVDHGDAGFEFPFVGECRMRILVWAADEEFPPSAQVLYTDNFAAAFAPEDRVVAGDLLISRIKGAM